MILLVITIPSSFWFHADSSTRYGLWHECVTVILDNNDLKNVQHENKQLEIGENFNQKSLVDSKLVCNIYNKGKNKM